MKARRRNPVDACIRELDCALRSLFTSSGTAFSPEAEDSAMSHLQAERSAAMVRVNLAGELAAQGLYRGQALAAGCDHTREHLLQAAGEEHRHLQWCRHRLAELGGAESLLNPFWYGGSVVIGFVAGMCGDEASLGFVVETEKQVEEHLTEQLNNLPENDLKSRKMLNRMREEEAEHAREAASAGGKKLPDPIPLLMKSAAAVMKRTAARI